jgi:ATP-dependent DNA ligase
VTKGPVHELYLGPGRKIGPELLGQYEGHGYRLEEKIDGHWCLLAMDHSEVWRFWSRLGNEIVDERIEGFHVPLNLGHYVAALVGELKDRKLYVFDTADPRRTYLDRRADLSGSLGRMLGGSMVVLPSYSKGFWPVYDGIIADGGEGVVLKHEESYYHSRRKDRKTGLWIKCKPEYRQQL